MPDQTYRLVVDLGSKGSLQEPLAKIGAQAAATDAALQKANQSAAQFTDKMGRLHDANGRFAGSGAKAFNAAAEGAKATQKATIGLEESLGRVKSLVGGIAVGVTSSLVGAFERVGDRAIGLLSSVGKIGAAAGLAGIGYGLKSNARLEGTQISLAGIFNANEQVGSLPEGMRKAADVMREMRKDANQLPGEFKDLIGMFRLVANPGFQAGASINRLEKLAAHGMATSAALGMPMEQASREMAMLLEGRAGAHNVLGLQLRLSGSEATSFNASSPAARLSRVEKELGRYNGLNDLFAPSMGAVSSTMKDNAIHFAEMATAGLGSRIALSMSRANEWFDKNSAKVERVADTIGLKLEYAFEVGEEKIISWYPAVRTFAEHASDEVARIWTAAEPIVERVGAKAKSLLEDPELFSKLENLGLLYAGAKVGGAVLGAAGAENVGMIAGSVAASPWIGAAPIAIGAGHILSDPNDRYHEEAIANASDAANVSARSLGHLGVVTDMLKEGFYNSIDPLSNGFVSAVDVAANALNAFANVAEQHIVTVKQGARDFFTQIGLAGVTFDPQHPPTDRGIYDVHGGDDGLGLNGIGALAGRAALAALEGFDPDEKKPAKRGAGGGGGGTHIQKVELVVSGVGDPDRVARLTIEKLQELGRSPTQSPFARDPLRR